MAEYEAIDDAATKCAAKRRASDEEKARKPKKRAKKKERKCKRALEAGADNGGSAKKRAKKEKKRERRERKLETEKKRREESVDPSAGSSNERSSKRRSKDLPIIDSPYVEELDGPGAIHSALDFDKTRSDSVVSDRDSSAASVFDDPGKGLTTLLLFYQYVEPPWDAQTYHAAKSFVESAGEKHGITGRMRVAREGLNCTLTGSYHGIRAWCRDLRTFGDRDEFKKTEFKLTDHLPRGQLFPKLNSFEVNEIVNYGLGGSKAPPIGKTGVHLEPEDYHIKMGEKDTVIIDVRNHYENNIGRLVPPETGAKYIDPNMRKSTEFPVWLDKPETKAMLKGKQVLMYCTGEAFLTQLCRFTEAHQHSYSRNYYKHQQQCQYQ